ncbi:biotin synthase BioB [Pseudodesulfovibrio tunisiensis]|uniref:biotin synthase BioB n=1 Tax=Pseudodesulfovibrio tunisiensis TaxID=463192 RepID=UPI001FB3934C|nr:radical SAM protein [Pseudodesulfovibrio tunisiensis]
MTKHDILASLMGANDSALFTRADRIRQDGFGNKVAIRAIVDFSNICDGECGYCGLRAPNSALWRYRMTPDTIMDSVDRAVAGGAETVVLRSGKDTGCDAASVAALVRRIKDRHDVAVTLSLGDRGLEEYRLWRDNGADRCIVKLETSDPRRFKRIHHGEDFAARLHRVERLHGMGYEIGSGVIADLPETGPLDALRDILFLTELDLDIIAVGPFVPDRDTPLGRQRPGSVKLSHRMTALLRILNPQSNIPAASALETLAPGSRAQALHRGCNVLTPVLTPEDLQQNDALENAKQTILSAGFVPSPAKGFSPRSNHVGQSAQRDQAGHHPCRAAECGQILAD